MPSNVRPVVFVAGTRPNFVKIAPLLRAIRGRATPAVLVHTGQHYDQAMSGIFFQQLGIQSPDVHLGIGCGSHATQTARVLESFEAYLRSLAFRPRGVVVVGDVNSTLACALAACQVDVPVAHVEAGLRSFDCSMPEEMNRVLTDAVSDLLFVSEPSGEHNLLKEGLPAEKIRLVGNVMIDTVVQELPKAKRIGLHSSLGLANGNFALLTLHRPSNVDCPEQLFRLVRFILELASRLPVVFPVHPRTRERLEALDLVHSLAKCPALHLLQPLGYLEILALLYHAKLVITDSGGLQEETTFLGTPCLTMRRTTERPATVSSGTNTVVGENPNQAFELVEQVLAGCYKTATPIQGWDGHASERIVNAVIECWGS